MLREPTQTPRVLVVLALPQDETEWLTITDAELVLRRCAYWVSLANAPERDNRESVTVSLPEHQRFDVAALRALMDHSRTGSLR
ncbi:DUF4365 domain-containing protein [Allochromatium palmeri]|uniref:DUF4365 domain-containing protein n=1 Tax=Allochromatium palmeri TaxID=231048 RepID=UPI0012D7683E|nr:DUF4365 domain-containing protein [Allochromatium palmeri]